MVSDALARHDPVAVRDLYARLRASGEPATASVRVIAGMVFLSESQVWRLLRNPDAGQSVESHDPSTR